MPLYEYQCRDCRQQFEIITTSAQQEDPVCCPACKSTDVTKNMSVVGFRLGSVKRPVRNSDPGCKPGSDFS